MIHEIYFWILAGLATLCGVGVLTGRHPIAGAVNLVGVMLSLAGIYGLLAGAFLSIVQVLVYAGAIMMLVVFVIMVLNSARDRTTPGPGFSFLPALLLPGMLVTLIVVVVGRAGLEVVQQPGQEVGEIAGIGARLFDFSSTGGGYYILFEIVGLVLLVALTVAVLLAKRVLTTTADDPAAGNEGGHA